MKIELENVLPAEIEKRSFAIISQELKERGLCLKPDQEAITKRVIHTTADFDYVNQLCFTDQAVAQALAALKAGASIVTDTQMVKAGINKKVLASLGGEAFCFMADPDVAAAAVAQGSTRARVSMDKGAKLKQPLIFAIGNAPTALIRLYELISQGYLQPALVIGVPVGFVNVVESKELILSLPVPSIVAKGRKGGSNVAAAICNALLYRAAEAR